MFDSSREHARTKIYTSSIDLKTRIPYGRLVLMQIHMSNEITLICHYQVQGLGRTSELLYCRDELK